MTTMVVIFISQDPLNVRPTDPMRLLHRPLWTLLPLVLAAGAACAQPHGDGDRSMYEQRRSDLRSALRGQQGDSGARPAGPQWQLSPEDRAAMRQQISREGQQRGRDRRDDRRR